MLDNRIKDNFNLDNFKNTFKAYKEAKTDIYTKEVKIQMGVDGIDLKNFERNIATIGNNVCNRALNGKYFFSPFREIEIPKPPYTNTQLKEARKAGKTRILSIATIKDTIFQKMLYNVIENYCEEKFNHLKVDVSYAYRRGKSAPLAVKNIYYSIINEEYSYALDGDIKKFFDEIPHDRLFEKLRVFFGENHLVIKYLKRFISSDRVEPRNASKDIREYYKKKPKRSVRKKGIPQGGVLSGLVANLYLNDFDTFIVSQLYPKYDNKIKYFRYADDFIILVKEKGIIYSLYNDIRLFLSYDGLELHSLGDKTKEINLLENKMDFLGFSISPKAISIKKDNIEKFKKRLIEKINKSRIYQVNTAESFSLMLNRLRFKLLGSGAFDEELLTCKLCGKKRPSRSWLRYFLVINDIRQLRALDIWVRKVIYRSYYNKTGRRLSKKDFLGYDLPSLEKLYYHYKKENHNGTKLNLCHCSNGELEEF